MPSFTHNNLGPICTTKSVQQKRIAVTWNQWKINGDLEVFDSDNTKHDSAMRRREQNKSSWYQFEKCYTENTDWLLEAANQCSTDSSQDIVETCWAKGSCRHSNPRECQGTNLEVPKPRSASPTSSTGIELLKRCISTEFQKLSEKAEEHLQEGNFGKFGFDWWVLSV